MPLADPWLPAAPVPPDLAFAPMAVYRVTGAAPTFTFTALPNVQCLAVAECEGPAPAPALFRYVFDDLQASTYPAAVEGVLSTTATGPYVVEVGDRLAVKAWKPDNTWEWIFDGYAGVWALTIRDGREEVTMRASSVARRLWDKPIGGQLQRNADAPATVADVPTDTALRFNPDGRPNATPSGADAGSGSQTYPTFLDPDLSRTDGGGNPYQRTWNIAQAARYLLFHELDPTFVQPAQTDAALDALLIARSPNGAAYDPANPATYTASPIAAADAPLSGKFLPPSLHDQIKDSGFGMSFPLTTDGSGNPVTKLNVFGKQLGAVKSVWLPTRGSDLDATLCNVGAADLARDLTSAVNQWVVEGALDRHEVSLILAPAFPMTATDSGNTNLPTYDSSSSGFATAAARDAYRLFSFGEAGDPFYLFGQSTAGTGGVPSLDAVLGAPAGSPAVAQYVKRRRRTLGDLITTGADGRALKARLAVSTDYAGSYPALWDGTGTWQHVSGGWEPLKDRLGVWLSGKHPNAWQIGALPGGAFPSGKVNVVERLAAGQTLHLRLTCTIEADQRLSAAASRQSSAALPWPVEQRVDAHDRYRTETVAAHSEFNTTASPVVSRDDTSLAQAEAEALRQASEAGVFDGQVEIPYCTRYYEIGDRIDQIAGRGLGLRTDSGGTGYAPVLPVVVGRRWDFFPGQRTVLTLSDAGLDRRRWSLTGTKPRGVASHADVPRSERDNA